MRSPVRSIPPLSSAHEDPPQEGHPLVPDERNELVSRVDGDHPRYKSGTTISAVGSPRGRSETSGGNTEAGMSKNRPSRQPVTPLDSPDPDVPLRCRRATLD